MTAPPYAHSENIWLKANINGNNLIYSTVISFNVNLQGTSLLQLNAGDSKLNVIFKKKMTEVLIV